MLNLGGLLRKVYQVVVDVSDDISPQQLSQHVVDQSLRLWLLKIAQMAAHNICSGQMWC